MHCGILTALCVPPLPRRAIAARSRLLACARAHARAGRRGMARDADPEERVRTALGKLYDYFRRTERFWVNVLRDAELSPIVQAGRQGPIRLPDRRPRHLSAGWRRRSTRRIAALGHGVDFRTWESLTVRQGLNDAQAKDLMLAFVRCAGRASASAPRKKTQPATGVRGEVAGRSRSPRPRTRRRPRIRRPRVASHRPRSHRHPRRHPRPAQRMPSSETAPRLIFPLSHFTFPLS